MDQVKVTAYFHRQSSDPADGPIAPDFPIIEKILDDFGEAALSLVNAYYITDAQGASKVGGKWMGAAKVFVCYCDDKTAALQVKNAIFGLAEPGRTIGFEMVSVEVFTFTAGSK